VIFAIPPRAVHFSTLSLLAALRAQGAPENLQCALPGSRFHRLTKNKQDNGVTHSRG